APARQRQGRGRGQGQGEPVAHRGSAKWVARRRADRSGGFGYTPTIRLTAEGGFARSFPPRRPRRRGLTYPTKTPPVNPGRASNPATRGPPWNPAATIRSPAPSPFTSPTAARAPPRKFGSLIPKKSASSPNPAPPKTRTRGPPPSSGVITRSGVPSPSVSPA